MFIHFRAETPSDGGNGGKDVGYENGYKYYDELKTYDDAQATCESEGTSLVEIGSEEEQNRLSGIFGDELLIIKGYWNIMSSS